MIVVRVEVTTLWDIKTKWRSVMIASEQVVRIVGKTRLHVTCLGQLWGPYTLVGILGLMDSHVGWPDSIINSALTEVPFLEVIRAMLLMTWMNLGKVDHLLDKLRLVETFLNKQIILLMHSSVAALASTGENLEASAESSRVVCVPGDVRWEVIVTVVHTN